VQTNVVSLSMFGKSDQKKQLRPVASRYDGGSRRLKTSVIRRCPSARGPDGALAPAFQPFALFAWRQCTRILSISAVYVSSRRCGQKSVQLYALGHPLPTTELACLPKMFRWLVRVVSRKQIKTTV
jgi:hypothetical protein